MSASVFVDIINGAITIALTIVLIVISKKNNTCNIEISMFENIHTAKINLDNALFDLSKYKRDEEKGKISNIKNSKNGTFIGKAKASKIKLNHKPCINQLIEDYLNAIGVACILYSNNNVNKKRFKKMYYDDIKNIINNSTYEMIYKNESQAYRSIIVVYHEWNKK